MEKNKKAFNKIRFRELLYDAYGSGYITHFAKEIKVSRTSVSEWVSTKTDKNPSAASWNKIEPLFAKKGINLKRRDFYKDSYGLPEEAPAITIENPKASYSKDDKQIIRDLRNELTLEKNQAHNRNETIVSLVEENRNFKEEIKELKAEIKKLKNRK